MNILIIPLDNRPVSYTLPEYIIKLNSSAQIFLPGRDLLGGLDFSSDRTKLLQWLSKILTKNKIDIVIASMDTIAYGGLVSSRRSPQTLEEIKKNLDEFKSIIKLCDNKPQIYGFSSIMRISNNNINEEEKTYWDLYGEKIFRYSFLKHKSSKSPSRDIIVEIEKLKNEIPNEIIEDYLCTRKRNFQINNEYIEWLKEGLFEYFVYCMDDAAEFGLNVAEKEQLIQVLPQNATVKTGADEIPSALLARGIIDSIHQSLKVFPVFKNNDSNTLISRYEDVSIKDSVCGQIELCGAKLVSTKENADLVLFVNNFEISQDDLALGLFEDTFKKNEIDEFLKLIKTSKIPFAVADVKNANGADDELVLGLLEQNIDLGKLYGYAGWNTSGNTIGSVLSMAIARLCAEKTDSFDFEIYKQLLFIRFVDDWAYQTIVRQKIREISKIADLHLLHNEIEPYLKRLADELKIDISEIKLSFPWSRTFEVEIEL